MPQRIWRKEGARLHDEQGGTAERGDERETWPVERERLPAAENSVLAFSFLGNPEIAEKTSYLHASISGKSGKSPSTPNGERRIPTLSLPIAAVVAFPKAISKPTTLI
jgi:hypothetical protein